MEKTPPHQTKNFLPSLVITIILWLLLGSLIYFVEPTTFAALPIFFIVVFITSLFTFSFIFSNTKSGILIALGITIFLILRYLGIGNILNALLIAGIILVIELYIFSSQKY